MTSIIIPNSVTSIGHVVFANCPATLIVGDNSYAMKYAAENELPYRIFAEELTDGDYQFTVENSEACITGYIGNDPDIILPEQLLGYPVTSVGNKAFYDCDDLTSITIPDSITSIGKSAFVNCSALTKFIVSLDHPTLAVIDDVLFYKPEKKLIAFPCALSLESYSVPQGILAIGENAFYGCKNLTSIIFPDSVTSIEDLAFSHCSGLRSITLPDSITSIGINPFTSCNSLEKIHVSSVHPTLAVIGDGLFYTPEKKLVTFLSTSSIEDYSIPQGILSIGDNAFYNCDNLISITIPDSVTSIGKAAFWSCSSLTSIAIPESVTYISKHAFSFCTNLTNIAIPNGVTSIGSYAFMFCSKLTSVSFPESVTSIGRKAFNSCSNLSTITLPDSVTSIGNDAFSDCPATLTVGRDSYARQYAIDNGIPYTYAAANDWLNN